MNIQCVKYRQNKFSRPAAAGVFLDWCFGIPHHPVCFTGFNTVQSVQEHQLQAYR